MTFYLIAHVEIRDPETYALYGAGFMPVLQQYKGQLLAVSDAPEVLEGETAGGRRVVVAFENRDVAMAWWNSPEYRAIVVHRHAASDALILGMEGLG